MASIFLTVKHPRILYHRGVEIPGTLLLHAWNYIASTVHWSTLNAPHFLNYFAKVLETCHSHQSCEKNSNHSFVPSVPKISSYHVSQHLRYYPKPLLTWTCLLMWCRKKSIIRLKTSLPWLIEAICFFVYNSFKTDLHKKPSALSSAAGYLFLMFHLMFWLTTGQILALISWKDYSTM